MQSVCDILAALSQLCNDNDQNTSSTASLLKAMSSFDFIITRAGTINRLIGYVVNADNRFVTVIIDYHNRFFIDAIHYKRWNISR